MRFFLNHCVNLRQKASQNQSANGHGKKSRSKSSQPFNLIEPNSAGQEKSASRPANLGLHLESAAEHGKEGVILANILIWHCDMLRFTKPPQACHPSQHPASIPHREQRPAAKPPLPLPSHRVEPLLSRDRTTRQKGQEMRLARHPRGTPPFASSLHGRAQQPAVLKLADGSLLPMVNLPESPTLPRPCPKTKSPLPFQSLL